MTAQDGVRAFQPEATARASAGSVRGLFGGLGAVSQAAGPVAPSTVSTTGTADISSGDAPSPALGGPAPDETPTLMLSALRELGPDLAATTEVLAAIPTPQPGPKVVAFGGGHGLSAALSALRHVTASDSLTAVVTVADNGGSSGRIRREVGGLPPGDLRMALAALCGDDEWGRTWADVLQHRFGGPADGELHGHAVGNLLITALWERLGEPVAALDWVGRLLGAHGRVLPMSTVPLEIEAVVAGIDPARPHEVGVVRGQHELAITPGSVQSVRLVPSAPPAAPEAVAAIRAADWTVLGPGSWFTSVIPHLLVPELCDALVETPARRLLTFNLAPQPGETDGMSPAQHLEVLADHCPRLRLDVVLADGGSCGDARILVPLEKAAATLGARVVLAPLAAPFSPEDKTARHDPALLAAAYRNVFRG